MAKITITSADFPITENRPNIKVEFHMPADQYDRFRQMAVELDMTGAEFCRRAVIGEMDAREGVAVDEGTLE